jgi:hypothetical protein
MDRSLRDHIDVIGRRSIVRRCSPELQRRNKRRRPPGSYDQQCDDGAKKKRGDVIGLGGANRIHDEANGLMDCENVWTGWWSGIMPR